MTETPLRIFLECREPPTPAERELEDADERAIDDLVEARTDELVTQAVRRCGGAQAIVDAIEDSDDEPLHLRAFAAAVGDAFAMHGPPCRLFTADERLERVRQAIEAAYLPIARLAAENQRDAIERHYIEDTHE
jgi:hypothetical protein